MSSPKLSRHQLKLQEIADRYQVQIDAVANNPAQQERIYQDQQLAIMKYKGSIGRLFCIEVLYRSGNEIKNFRLTNQEGSKVMEFRTNIFNTGLAVPTVPGSWKIVPPYAIEEINLTIQSKYFE